mmetsp:Transcript_23177/g.33989  ORF Transcript_23177/g.33989 Transcript_23177/m.33989 type:complete len:613 (+) Transcript_23177:219-2057(+)|eukprot:CAMPEP_0185026568 /NCGR_PEP_ID=MMETSP1103-20130426/10932_1 /TAXON_ID=36769 /ORGANISM="Paraphysomonas bandaiensis, Strain Caron Lab Isolate" /LENGTH=612 /DNA_ID=CAMNT_0027560195 /DNA_START=117 /DNA_END=1955 /DNA_ORIENTATION=-
MSGRSRADPNDWARKRKEAIERAKQLREERKSGNNELDENYTFKPQVNKRPQYLQRGDSLDNLTGASQDTNGNIFEQPLPGSRKPNPNDIFEQAVPSDGLNPSPLDSLGSELNRYPTKSKYDGDTGTGSASPFRSKFMQQYENQGYDNSSAGRNGFVEPTPEPPQRSTADVEAEETFLSTLRGGNSTSGNSDGPGWNDDTSSPGIPQLQRKVSYRRRKSNQGAATRPPPPVIQPRRSGRNMPEWNSDTEFVPGEPPALHQGRRECVQSSPSTMRGAESSRGSNQHGGDVSHAKSRLSLLKSKMKRSDSGGDLRSLSAQNGRDKSDERRKDTRQPSSNDGDYGYEPTPSGSARVRVMSEEGAASLPPRSSRPRDQTHQQHTYRQEEAHHSEPPQQPTRRPSRHATPPPDRHNAPSPAQFGDAVPDEADTGEQRQCPDCGRKFNPIPYEKHIKICAKVFLQKRKAFDSKKMRINDNPELVQIIKKQERVQKKVQKQAAPAHSDKPVGGGKGAKWKEQSNELRIAMKAARMAARAEATGEPMPVVQSAPDSSLVPCPNCGRTFNERAAERHIPQCKNIRAQPKMLMRGSGGSGGRNGAPTAKTKGGIASKPKKLR